MKISTIGTISAISGVSLYIISKKMNMDSTGAVNVIYFGLGILMAALTIKSGSEP